MIDSSGVPNVPITPDVPITPMSPCPLSPSRVTLTGAPPVGTGWWGGHCVTLMIDSSGVPNVPITPDVPITPMTPMSPSPLMSP
ncbi:hypothetical protein Q9966_016557 [Columba livia]|nr:hypothetical protein Q9966_016557 [Columba livia]